MCLSHPKYNNHDFVTAAGIAHIAYGHYAQLLRLSTEQGHPAKRAGV